ncbi:Ubiquitin carboxyl-terminal hydrolase 22 [Platanthera guangdongensis]|uniref:Ubiquitin carboxyl-terminal hydrolase 22 n=1 Tax=Platanthera guangdongensis TaxID=2320717 RepID=A0ABR2MPW7_9ASPA
MFCATLGTGDCCIVHNVFSGTLRSDVTSTIYGYTSSTFYPCVDMSFNLNHSIDYKNVLVQALLTAMERVMEHLPSWDV